MYIRFYDAFFRLLEVSNACIRKKRIDSIRESTNPIQEQGTIE